MGRRVQPARPSMILRRLEFAFCASGVVLAVGTVGYHLAGLDRLAALSQTTVTLVAVRRADGTRTTNPPPELDLVAEDVLVRLGDREKLREFKRLAAPGAQGYDRLFGAPRPPGSAVPGPGAGDFMSRLLSLPILGLALLVACSSGGDDPTQDPPPTTVSYALDLQPIFNTECIHCHGGAGGLDLQDYEGLMAGGNSGAVVVAGDPDSSRLIDRLNGTITPTMPADGPPLTGPEIARIEQWILEGAQDN